MAAPAYAAIIKVGTPIVIEFRTQSGGTDTRHGIWEKAGRADAFWSETDGPGAGHPCGMPWEHILSIATTA